jgi:cytochrome bd-type quinol oxidase subunit 2
LTTELFTPLTLYAMGLVMRGSAFTFRHYDVDPGRRRRLGALFSAASVGCPFLLGAMGGALVREQPLSLELDVFVVASGFFLLALVAALAATVVLGWAVAKGEVLVWAEHTLVSSRAHPATLQWLLVICVGAAVLVLPSLALLFAAFGRRAVKS